MLGVHEQTWEVNPGRKESLALSLSWYHQKHQRWMLSV